MDSVVGMSLPIFGGLHFGQFPPARVSLYTSSVWQTSQCMKRRLALADTLGRNVRVVAIITATPTAIAKMTRYIVKCRECWHSRWAPAGQFRFANNLRRSGVLLGTSTAGAT